MRLIIEISEEDRKDIGNIHFVREDLRFKIGKAIMKGTPLDDVISEIDKAYDDLDGYYPYALGTFANMVSDIFDNIGEKSEGANEERRSKKTD